MNEVMLAGTSYVGLVTLKALVKIGEMDNELQK